MKSRSIAVSSISLLILMTVSCHAETLTMQQTSKVNIWSFFQDNGGSDTITVKQIGDTNIAINSEKNGSQSLGVTQLGRINVLNSSQISASPNGANAVVATQSAGGNSGSSAGNSSGSGVSYTSAPVAGGYLSSFTSDALSITLFGKANSISTIGRRY